MCYLSTLAQTLFFYFQKIRVICWKTLIFSYTAILENLAENLWFSMPAFEYSFKTLIIEFFRNSFKNIEVKLFQKVRNFYTFYEIGFENKKFLGKFRDCQKGFQSFSDKFSEIFIHIKVMWKVDITSQFSWTTFRPIFDEIRPGK